jgi:hypothetical protein
VNCKVKVYLGVLACAGIEANLDADAPAGVKLALADYVRRLEAGLHPIGLPRFAQDWIGSGRETMVEVSVGERAIEALEREAGRLNATVDQVATHSVLVYLAELDRLTPLGPSRLA